nr:IS4 family transposase [Anaplasma marginale]
MLYPFPKIVKHILKDLPQNDYPALNSRLFVSCWLGFSLDKSLTSMRDLFRRLKIGGINIDISTFSKASKKREIESFKTIYQNLTKKIQRKSDREKYNICPIDSTVITLTSKLLHNLGFHQVKLFSNFNSSTGLIDDNLINFGSTHDYKFGDKMINSLAKNAVGVLDRGFASKEFLKKTLELNKNFVIRISKLYKLEFIEDSEYIKVGRGKDSGLYRVVNFCDIQTKTEYRLVTNLPSKGEKYVSNEEISQIYRQRWGIECLWKFLKMHLKLDDLITKNINGITIQIYSTLIAYLILHLVEIPQEFGNKLLDKLCYLQACMCQEISYIHWMKKITKYC